MSNPLRDYVTAFAPSFDYSDARTFYDGLWGGGQWPPEGYPHTPRVMGMRGINDNLLVWNQPAAFFRGDRSRIAAGRAAGMSGVGSSNDPNIVCDASCNCVDQTTLNVVDPATAGCTVASAQPSPSTPCFVGPVGALQPGQVYCQNMSTQSPFAPGSPSGYAPQPLNLPNQQQQQQRTGTAVLVAGGIAVLMLFMFMKV
jgi:hypothetical protein